MNIKFVTVEEMEKMMPTRESLMDEQTFRMYPRKVGLSFLSVHEFLRKTQKNIEKSNVKSEAGDLIFFLKKIQKSSDDWEKYKGTSFNFSQKWITGPGAPRVYVASSFKNLVAVKLLNCRLRERGYNVLDWTKKAPPVPAELTPEQRRAELDKDTRGEIFSFCKNACGQADAVIYLGPSGQDAGIEVGLAHAAGILIYGMASPMEAIGTMLNGCVDRWFTCPNVMLNALDSQFKERVFY